MFKTKVTELLGIQYPIVVGTMAHLAKADWIGSISEAGALGIMASTNYMDKEGFRKAVRRVKEITDKPFAVNLNLFPAFNKLDNSEYIDVILDEGVPVVETSGHKAPEEYIDRLKKGGVKLIHKCVGVRYAKKAESLGVDAVTVVGYENGGATGTLDITTLCLVPLVVDSVKIPVIGGGGISDGRGMMAVLALGAEGVIVGTRFLLSKECPMHDNIKQALVKASELDTILVLRSLQNTHRVWTNKAALKTAEMESKGASLEELYPLISGDKGRKMFQEGDIDLGLLACGQGIGIASSVKSGKEIIQEMLDGARKTAGRLSSLFED